MCPARFTLCQTASAALSRRVQKAVDYPPLCEMSDVQRRELHQVLLEADNFEDLPGKGRRRSSKPSRSGPTYGSWATTSLSPRSPPAAAGETEAARDRRAQRRGAACPGPPSGRRCHLIRRARRMPPSEPPPGRVYARHELGGGTGADLDAPAAVVPVDAHLRLPSTATVTRMGANPGVGKRHPHSGWCDAVSFGAAQGRGPCEREVLEVRQMPRVADPVLEHGRLEQAEYWLRITCVTSHWTTRRQPGRHGAAARLSLCRPGRWPPPITRLPSWSGVGRQFPTAVTPNRSRRVA
jgi:hypothetical protein